MRAWILLALLTLTACGSDEDDTSKTTPGDPDAGACSGVS
jgi:hypothetical protein